MIEVLWKVVLSSSIDALVAEYLPEKARPQITNALKIATHFLTSYVPKTFGAARFKVRSSVLSITFKPYTHGHIVRVLRIRACMDMSQS